MANTYTRRINLYINGKEVANNISSVRKEMYKLTNEQSRMTIGSKEYMAHAAKIKQLKGIMNKHNADLRQTEKSWFSLKKAADGFNKYFGMITAGLASFAGVAISIKSAVTEYAKFDDKLSDVMKTTGLTKDQVNSLNKELEKLDTRTAQENLLDLARVAGKLGITAEDEILGFVRAADKINVALAEDLGGNTEDAINQLGKLVDIFKLKDEFGMEDSLLKIGSAINSLGAAGTANELYLVEFSKRVAGIAPSAGVSIEQILGLGATLDELGQTSEVSGTTYAKVIGGMFKDTTMYARIAGMEVKDFTDLLNTDANEAFIKVLEGAKGSGTGFAELATNLSDLGLDGARSTAVLGVLANNIDKLREKQAFATAEFEKGTSILDEYNIKNTNAQAELEKARKAFAKMQRELGERLAPAYASVIHKGSAMIKVLGLTVEFLFKYGQQLLVIVSTIAAYTVAVKLATLWQNRSNAATLASIVSQKLQALAFNAQFAAIALYNTAIALMTGKLKVAAIQFRAFSAALAANPIGIVVGAVVALGAGLYMLSKRLTATEKLQRTLNKVNLDANKSIIEEKLEMERLLKVAQNNLRSKEDRLAAIKRLNEISPEFLGNLTLENINTNTATEATKKYTTALLENAKAQAAKEKLADIEKELLDLQMGEGAKPNFWQQTWNGIKTGGNVAAMAVANATTAANNLIKKEKELNLQKEKLIGITEKQINLDNKKGNTGADTGNVTPDAPGSTGTPGDDKLKALETALSREQNLIKQQLLDKLITEEEANDALLTAEIEFLEKKKALQIVYGEDYLATEGALIDKKLQQAKEADKKTEAERKAAHAAALNDLDNKEAEQLNLIKKQLADGLITEEQAQQDILLKEIEFLNQRIALKTQWGEDTAELEGKILDKTNKIADNALKADEDRARLLHDLRRDFEDEEILKAEEKAAALAELDMLHKAGLLESEEEYQRLKTNIVEKYEENRFQTTSNYLNAANNLLGGAASFFADMKDAELEKAGDNAEERIRIEEEYAKKQKGIAIAQAIIAGAMAIMELWANKSVLPEPAASIYKGVMTGVIVGTTIAQIAKIKSAKFAEGKYPGLQTRDSLHTGMYGDKPQMAIFNEVPGQPEMVIDGITTRKIRVNYPEIQKAIYDIRDGRKPQTYADGKYPLPSFPAAPPASPPPYQGGVPAGGGSSYDPELTALIRENLKTMKELQKLKVSLSLETFEKERGKYIDIKQTSGL